MGEERIVVGRLDGLRRRGERGIRVAIPPQRALRCLLRERLGLTGKAFAALRRGGALVPLDAQLVAGRLRLPPRVGDDRDAGHQAGEVRRSLDDERVLHARHRLDLVEIGADDLPAEHRAFLEDRMQHPRHRHVDTEDRLAGDDGLGVDVPGRLTDDAEVLRVLELHRLERGWLQRRRLRQQVCVGHASPRALMVHRATARGQLVLGDPEGLRGGRDQHRAAGGADATHRQPVVRGGGAAARALGLVLRGIEVTLLDADLVPVHVQLLGDEHGQHRLHALPDFRVLGDDGDEAVGRERDVGVRRELGGLGGRQGIESPERFEGRDQHPAARERGDLQELAPVDLGGSRLGGFHVSLLPADCGNFRQQGARRVRIRSPLSRLTSRTAVAVSGRHLRRPMDRFADAVVGRATADVAVHRAIDVRISRSRCPR